MRVREMFDRILIESGQYFNAGVTELDIDKFKTLVQICLGTYNQYYPYDEKFQLNIPNLSYTFTNDVSHTTLPLGIPDWISDIVPVRLAGVHPWYFRHKEEWVNKELEYKKQFPWDYIKPTLYVPVQAMYQVHGVWNHRVVEVASQSKKDEKQYECLTIDHNDDDFFDLLTARFLKSVGRNRRAFTLNDLPITVDADTLVSEGESMEALAKEDMENKSNKFWLAWR